MDTKQKDTKQEIQRFSVGLTGGIGSGKSTVADMFAHRGASIIDTDVIAHDITSEHGTAMTAIRSAFGDAYILPNGAMDRSKMRALIFSDTTAKAKLEQIVHPLIRNATETAAEEAQGAYIMFAVPLLIESGSWRQRVSRVLVIDCPEDMQIARVGKRSGLDEHQVRAIMATQASRTTRLAAADDVLLNDGETSQLEMEIDRLHQLYSTMAKQVLS